MTCRSDYYKEGQPVGWSSLSRETMPNMAWEFLRQSRRAHVMTDGDRIA